MIFAKVLYFLVERAAEPLELFEGSTACMFAPHDVSHNWLRSLQTTWMRLDLALEADPDSQSALVKLAELYGKSPETAPHARG